VTKEGAPAIASRIPTPLEFFCVLTIATVPETRSRGALALLWTKTRSPGRKAFHSSPNMIHLSLPPIE
jgi:hypothetical protein